MAPEFGPGVGHARCRSLTIWLTLVFGLPALFLLAHPYLGIYHDGVYYAFYALQHLEPRIYDGDFFVRVVSQDSFTLFSAPYAELVRVLGVETAAHVVARVGAVAVYVMAALLARRLMDREVAWLAIALFLVIPGFYGARLVFSYGEDFATPRPLAEALVLASFCLLLSGRRVGAAVVSLLSVLLHPLMALPGVLVVVVMSVRPRVTAMLALLACVATGIACWVAMHAPVGVFQLVDPEWRRALQLLHYLLVDEWSITDWQPNGVALVTLVLALVLLPKGPVRRLALAGLIVGAAGIVLSTFASIVVRFAPLVSGQPWRWLWVSKALAVLLLPPIGGALWSRGIAGYGACALLIVAWVGSFEPVGIPAALLVLLAVLMHDRGRGLARYAPWLVWLPILPFAFAIVRLMGTMTVQLLIAAMLVPIWWVVFRGRGLLPRVVCVSAALLFLVNESASAYLDTKRSVDSYPVYDQQIWTAFAPWRERIRTDQTVLFVGRPEMVWLTLHRRSYQPYTPVAFSRAAAMATLRRLESLGFYADESRYSSDPLAREPPLSVGMLRRICEVPEIDFVVSGHELPLPHEVSRAPRPFDHLSLYRCTDLAAP